MDILKLATEWAKSEVFSTRFFILFAILFLIASIGFWQLGKTNIARAYIIPTLVAGVVLLTIGLGLFYTNKLRITKFEIAYNKDSSAFVESEFIRIEKALNEYTSIVFKAIPFIIIGASLFIIFVDRPIWRASAIIIIAMMVIILLVDGTAHDRNDDYKQNLELVKENKLLKSTYTQQYIRRKIPFGHSSLKIILCTTKCVIVTPFRHLHLKGKVNEST